MRLEDLGITFGDNGSLNVKTLYRIVEDKKVVYYRFQPASKERPKEDLLIK